MKKLNYPILLTIVCFLLVLPCRAQVKTSTTNLNFEVRHVFTGIVNQPLDSVFMDVCIINNRSLTGNEKFLVTRQNDTVTMSSASKSVNKFINKNGNAIVVLGYTSRYNPSLQANIVGDSVMTKVNSPKQSVILDASLVKQLKSILDIDQNK